MPVDALTRYSVRDGENGPPWGPKKAMLAEGVTINEGEDCPVGLCAALVCANNKIAGRVNKPIDAIWPVVIIPVPPFRLLSYPGGLLRAKVPGRVQAQPHPGGIAAYEVPPPYSIRNCRPRGGEG